MNWLRAFMRMCLPNKDKRVTTDLNTINPEVVCFVSTKLKRHETHRAQVESWCGYVGSKTTQAPGIGKLYELLDEKDEVTTTGFTMRCPLSKGKFVYTSFTNFWIEGVGEPDNLIFAFNEKAISEYFDEHTGTLTQTGREILNVILTSYLLRVTSIRCEEGVLYIHTTPRYGPMSKGYLNQLHDLVVENAALRCT